MLKNQKPVRFWEVFPPLYKYYIAIKSVDLGTVTRQQELNPPRRTDRSAAPRGWKAPRVSPPAVPLPRPARARARAAGPAPLPPSRGLSVAGGPGAALPPARLPWRRWQAGSSGSPTGLPVAKMAAGRLIQPRRASPADVSARARSRRGSPKSLPFHVQFRPGTRRSQAARFEARSRPCGVPEQPGVPAGSVTRQRCLGQLWNTLLPLTKMATHFLPLKP